MDAATRFAASSSHDVALAVGERERVELVALALRDGQHGGRVEASAQQDDGAFWCVIPWLGLKLLQIAAAADVHRRRDRIALVDVGIDALVEHALGFEDELDGVARRAVAAARCGVT